MKSIRLIATFVCALTAFGQQAPIMPELQRNANGLLHAPIFPAKGWWDTRFAHPSFAVEVQPIVRLGDFAKDGKLELSMRDYLDLVMTNNTDVAIQRMALEIPRNAITRAFAPFDPTLGLAFSATRRNTPATNQLQGAAIQSTLSQPGSATYVQLFDTGTQITAGYNASKFTTNDSFALFNPALTSNFSISFNQPLLRNRGRTIQRLPITIARTRLRGNEFQVKDVVMRLVASAETIYWDVVEARENLKVQEEFLKLQDLSLKRAQRELELGALSPLEIYQPQFEYANAEVQVIQARYRLAQREDALRRQIGADLDPQFRQMPVVLTESILTPADAQPVDREEAVQRALSLRPDLGATRVNLELDDLNIRSATNRLRPDFNFGGGYTTQGRSGDFFGRGAGGVILPVAYGGFWDAMSQAFRGPYPVWALSLSMSLPIRDRRVAADLADAMVQKKLDAYTVRTAEQQVRLEVLTAVNSLESAQAAFKQAQIARDFAQKRVEAEQKRYELGTTVLFFVLDAQTRLNQADNQVLQQSINYRRSLVNLLRFTGELLQERGIVLQ